MKQRKMMITYQVSFGSLVGTVYVEQRQMVAFRSQEFIPPGVRFVPLQQNNVQTSYFSNHNVGFPTLAWSWARSPSTQLQHTSPAFAVPYCRGSNGESYLEINIDYRGKTRSSGDKTLFAEREWGWFPVCMQLSSLDLKNQNYLQAEN